jgi:hypothetical protein
MARLAERKSMERCTRVRYYCPARFDDAEEIA